MVLRRLLLVGLGSVACACAAVIASSAPGLAAPGTADAVGTADATGDRTLRLAAVGDVMASRKVAATLERVGAAGLFGAFAAELRAADVAFANVESIVSAEPPGKGLLLRSPLALADALAFAGVDVASVANNHALDCGLGALLASAERLRAAGVRPIGLGADRVSAAAPLLLEQNGLRLAFIAYSRWMNPAGRAHGPAASARLSLDPKRVRETIAAARSSADVVIVSCHWGAEHVERPLHGERRWAKLFAEAGADLVLGHHPHVLQGIGREGRAVVAYSLGNFVFDLSPIRDRAFDTMLLHATLGRGGVRSIEAVPARIARDGIPAPATGPDRARIVERLGRLSAELGVRLEDDGRSLRSTF